ncbi:MAG: hypothetical protein OJF49_003838 [Ktedonobacterales bacterium]|nr:MAG: hypothetical protein OJF49_003838 [Ktedonobacterales bacterium]
MHSAERGGTGENRTIHHHDGILACDMIFEFSDEAVTTSNTDTFRSHASHAGERR